MTTTAAAAGTGENAREEATATALRTAVERACGVFLTAESKTENYQATYDKVFANAVGFVKRYDVSRTWIEEGKTFVTVKALVSTQKFAKDWAAIAHTVNQEDNPRVIVVIAEATAFTDRGPTYRLEENGIAQSRIEDFLRSKGISLKDRQAAAGISNRDLMLAALKDDAKEAAALGLRFQADVVIIGQASARHGGQIAVGGQNMHQYAATLNVRVIQTDSASLLASKNFTTTFTSLLASGGEQKALVKLADEAAPKLLAEMVEAWRKRHNVLRTVELSISGMDFDAWKPFKAELEQIDGVKAVRLRDITESTASLDVECRQTAQQLADRLTSMKATKLKVTEFTANRLKLAAQK